MACNVTKFYAEWIKAAPSSENRYLSLILVSNDKGGPARYAEGRLNLKSNPIVSPGSFLVGEATLYESNERWIPSGGSGDFQADDFPFDPKKRDKVKISIAIDSGRVRITSDTKGEATIDNPQCMDFLVFGFATAGSGSLGVGGSGILGGTVRPYYVISLAGKSEGIPE